MKTFLSRWRPRHLFSVWFMYWVVLAAVALSAPLGILWGLTHTGVHGDASLGVNDGMVTLTVHTSQGPAWAGHIHFLPLALWLVGPPFVVWALWVASRPNRVAVARDDAAR